MDGDIVHRGATMDGGCGVSWCHDGWIGMWCMWCIVLPRWDWDVVCRVATIVVTGFDFVWANAM